MTPLARNMPVLAVLAAALVAIGLLMVPVRLPIGANYWDLYFHLDGAWRIVNGQVPHADFFAPAGALPLYALVALRTLLLDAHPLLAGQYAFVFISVPAMLAVALAHGQSAATRLLVVLPWAIAGLLPFNVTSFFPAPGVDAIGLYNRQAGLLLYALFALIALRPVGRPSAVLAGLLLAALMLTKVNMAVAGIGLCAIALIGGRIHWRDGAIALAVALLVLAVLAIRPGITLPYLADIAAMAQHNSGRLSARIVTFVSVRFDVIGPLALLVLLLIGKAPPAALSLSGLRLWLGQPAALLGAAASLLLLAESQNTGGQEFLPLWPLIVVAWTMHPFSRAVAFFVALVALPSAVAVLHHAARAIAVAPGYVASAEPLSPSLGRNSVKADMQERETHLRAHYAANQPAYAALAATDEMPEAILYSTPSFQALYRTDIAVAADAIRRFEAERGKPLQSLYTLDSVDVLPLVLGKVPVKGGTISFDAGRGFPSSRIDRMKAALGGAEALLEPRCPVLPARENMKAIFAEVLKGRQTITIDACWVLHLKP